MTSSLAAGEGFEPSQTESESGVLPLHKPAVFRRTLIIISHFRKMSIGNLKFFQKRAALDNGKGQGVFQPCPERIASSIFAAELALRPASDPIAGGDLFLYRYKMQEGHSGAGMQRPVQCVGKAGKFLQPQGLAADSGVKAAAFQKIQQFRLGQLAAEGG